MSKLKENSIEEVSCRGLNHLGQGVVTLADGQTAFIKGLIPGEQARVQITARKKTYALGKIIKLLQASPERCTAPCPVFGRCGGCSLQHIAYEAQLRYKADAVRAAFIRLGAFDSELIEALWPLGSAAEGSDPPWHYRAKSQLPIQGSAQEPQIGFFAVGSHEVVDSEVCLIQDRCADLLRAVLRDCLKEQPLSIYDEQKAEGLLRHLVMRSSEASKDVAAVLVVNLSPSAYQAMGETSSLGTFLKAFVAKSKEVLSSSGYNLSSVYLNHNTKAGNLITGRDYSHVYYAHPLQETILGLHYQISPGAFFQVNPRQTEKLFSAVLKAAALAPDERAFDLYCGTGSISLQLAREAKSVKACELVASAITDAQHNAELNGIANVEFETGKAEVLVPQWLAAGETADVIVVDPPRKGLDESLVETLRQAKAERLVYVSCDPSTLARDCRRLCAGGLYSLQSIECFDMFPSTMHCESIVLLQRVDT